MGFIKFLSVRFVEVIVVLLLILFMPSIPPKANFTSFKVTPSLELKGNLALNNRLKGAERIYENELRGAEAFAEYNGELYAALYTGEVVKLSKGHVVPIVQFGKPCAGPYEESICGRPLGIQFDKQGNLYAADAYMGIWKVDIKTGKKTLLVSMDEEIEGKKPMLPNALTLSENGDFYWTDSTADFKLQDLLYSVLADGSGRLIHYNAKTKTNKVLMDGLHFANGVLLSPDEEFLIVAESATSRIYRFYLKGAKAGTHDIFADGLPGLPDNITPDGTGGFFVSCTSGRDQDNPIISQVIGPFPWIRKLWARIIGILDTTFQTADKIYPNIYTQMAIHWVGHFESVAWLFPKRATVLRFSKTGEIIESLYSTDKSMFGISEAFIHGDHLYLGSPFNEYVGKISLEKAGLQHLRKRREIPTQKPTPGAPIKTTQAKAPEETTPKPSPSKQTPPSQKQAPPTPVPVKQTPTPAAAPVKQTPPPTAAPVKQTPPPTAAPVKQTPPPAAAPVKQAPPPVAAPVKQAPPPAAAPVKQAVPTKQAPPPPAAAASVKQAPPPQKAAPGKQTPTPAPVKQAPPPTPAPEKKAVPVQQTPPPKAAPVKQTQPPKAAPVKQTQPPKAAPVKETPPPQEAPAQKVEKPKTVPVKENSVPKPRI